MKLVSDAGPSCVTQESSGMWKRGQNRAAAALRVNLFHMRDSSCRRWGFNRPGSSAPIPSSDNSLGRAREGGDELCLPPLVGLYSGIRSPHLVTPRWPNVSEHFNEFQHISREQLSSPLQHMLQVLPACDCTSDFISWQAMCVNYSIVFKIQPGGFWPPWWINCFLLLFLRLW